MCSFETELTACPFYFSWQPSVNSHCWKDSPVIPKRISQWVHRQTIWSRLVICCFRVRQSKKLLLCVPPLPYNLNVHSVCTCGLPHKLTKQISEKNIVFYRSSSSACEEIYLFKSLYNYYNSMIILQHRRMQQNLLTS